MNRLALLSLLGSALLLPHLASAQPAAASGNSVLRQSERRVGDWIIARYEDAGNNRLVRCEMERTYPDGSVLRVESAPRRPLVLGFATAGASLDRLGPSFEVRYWVDDENGTLVATATATPPRSARFTEADADTGTLDGLAAGQDLAIMAGEMSLRFSLRGSGAAVRALNACIRG